MLKKVHFFLDILTGYGRIVYQSGDMAEPECYLNCEFQDVGCRYVFSLTLAVHCEDRQTKAPTCIQINDRF